jgi:hypothetical protein
MALTGEDSRSRFPDSTRGGSFPVSEIWDPGPRIPSAPYDVRDVGFTVRVEIRYKDSMLETDDAIQGALDQAGVTATAEAFEYFERPSCRSRPEGVPGELRSLGVILAPCGEVEDRVPHPMDGAAGKKQSERAKFRANKRPKPSEQGRNKETVSTCALRPDRPKQPRVDRLRCDRPKQPGSNLATPRECVCLSPSTDERLPLPIASVSSDRRAQDKEERLAGPHTFIGHLKKMRGKHNLLFGLTNDAFGYSLTKVDFASFLRYEYVSRTSPGEMAGEILIEQALDPVNRSPAPDH